MTLELLVDRIETLLDEALAEQPADLPSSALLTLSTAVDRTLTKASALLHRSVSAYDASGEWEIEGHRNAADAVKHHRQRSANTAKSFVKLGKALRAMPHTDHAFASGTITEEHVRVLVGANKAHLPFTEAEALLVGYAQDLSFADFVKAVRYWEQVANADAADEDAQHKELRREFHASRTLDGMGRLDGWLDPIAFAEFQAELRRLEKLEFDIDWAEGLEQYGPTVTLAQLTRTSAQRRADALVEMARRSAGAGEVTYNRPTVNLHGDIETFNAVLRQNLGLPFEFPADRMCELDDGTVITPQQLFEQALRGHIRRVVWDSPNVLAEFGRRGRFFTGALREALCVRDRVCRHPSCDLPATSCEADHIIEWAADGPTEHRNGAMLCSYHHRRKRRTTYSLAA